MTKRWLIPAAIAALTACAGARLPTARPSEEPLLTIRGQVKDGPYYLLRPELERLPRGGFRARAPGADRELRYDGVALAKLLDYWVQPEDGADTLVLVTPDGRAIPVGLSLLRQYGPILADRVDGQPAAPQLAWPNLDQRGLEADPRAALWWTGPVEAVEVLAWDRTWGRALRPPPGSSDAARLGAGQYALRCAGCHQLHGVGGRRGPALGGAVGRLGEDPFLAAVARHAGWPSRVGAELVPGEEVARQVAAFLAASDLSGLEPVEPRPKSPPRSPARPGRY